MMKMVPVAAVAVMLVGCARPAPPSEHAEAAPMDRNEQLAQLARGEVPGFGGVWLEGCTYVIALRDPTHGEAARRYFEAELRPRPLGVRQGCPPEGPTYRIAEVRYDYAQLYDWYRQLAPIAWRDREIVMSGIEGSHNRVAFGVATPAAAERVRARLARTRVPADAWDVHVTGPVELRNGSGAAL
jgi:hypothetical protein